MWHGFYLMNDTYQSVYITYNANRNVSDIFVDIRNRKKEKLIQLSVNNV